MVFPLRREAGTRNPLGGLFAQLKLASIDPEEQLREQIAEFRAETGLARPADLIEPLRALAALHEEAGDHALAP